MSERRRFRAPPMQFEGAQEQAPGSSPRVRLDEKVVRTLLQVNPGLRVGRTTLQVKRDLENGTAAPAASQPSQPSQPLVEPLSRPTPSAETSPRAGLADALDFFMGGQRGDLERRVESIAQRRRALDEEEAGARRDVVDRLVTFFALLDATVVATHGVTVLSRHVGFLSELGVSPAELVAAARQRPPHRK